MRGRGGAGLLALAPKTASEKKQSRCHSLHGRDIRNCPGKPNRNDVSMKHLLNINQMHALNTGE